MPVDSCDGQLCSVVSRNVGEDPVGTASSQDLVLALEVALPWEREIWKSRDFPAGVYDLGLQAIDRGLSFRFLCVAPDSEYSVPGMRRFMVLRKEAGAIAGYRRDEYVLPDGESLAFVGALLQEPERLAGYARYRADTDGVRDLMVCTHGTMDAACARFGYPLYDLLRTRYAPALGGQLRAWRVSHFGGHRFAPTVLDYPEGRSWAHLDPEDLELLVLRNGPVSMLRLNYRGWGGLSSPLEQAAEREAFEREGWTWVDYAKSGQVVVKTETGGRVRIDFASPDGQVRGAYQATVELAGRLQTLSKSGATEPYEVEQYRVTSLERL